jgi:hypothetical protein
MLLLDILTIIGIRFRTFQFESRYPSNQRHYKVNMWEWMWACEHELVNKNKYIWNIFMTGPKYFLNIPMPHRNNARNIFPQVHGWKSQNGWKVWMKVEHQWTLWMISANRWIVWMKDLIGWNVWMKLIPK